MDMEIMTGGWIKKAIVMCRVIPYMEIQTFATAQSNLEDII